MQDGECVLKEAHIPTELTSTSAGASPRAVSAPLPGSLLAQLGPAPNIVIVRRGRMGDMVVFSPALRALRRAVPGARITLIADPPGATLARRYPWIDELHVGPFPDNGQAEPLDEFVARMRRRHFDLALQCTGGGETMNEFVLRLGASYTAGQRGPNAPELDLWMPFQQPLQHEPLRLLDVMALVGVPPAEPWTEVPVLTEDFAELARVREIDRGSLGDGRVIGLHPGSGSGSRRWPRERYARLLDALTDEMPHDIVLVGAESEREIARAVISRLRRPERVTDLTGRLTLGALIALLSQLYLYIGNDSGPAHIATALDTPAVLIYGSGHPATWAPMRRGRQRPVYDRSAPCRVLGQRCGCEDDENARCLTAVSVDRVLGEIRSLTQLLEFQPQRREATA